MVEAAIKELGLAGFKEKLRHLSWIAPSTSKLKIIRGILLCAYQRLSFSSTKTHSAAKALAEQLGVTFLDLDLEPIHVGYRELVEKALGESIRWNNDDIALQNIQARVRSPAIWFIANVRKSLLLTTSNMSEAAVGYTTMDGDSSGGLAPLAGISKSFLREWLVWLERKGPLELRRFSALKGVNSIPPTAELRQASENQTDEGDLMPYTVLDAIERLAVRDKLSPLEVWRGLSRGLSSGHSAERLVGWIERFFRLWSANQWKRERYAPAFHLDDHSVDPKSWCRFPILSGGFEAELSELRRVALQERQVRRITRGR
jgi:NAD+ synthase (glutamine-hydrolysing)